MLSNQKFVSELDEVKDQRIGLMGEQKQKKYRSGEFQTIALEAISKDQRMKMLSNVPKK